MILIMVADWTIIAAAAVLGLSSLGCVYFFTSSRVALEETKTERARIYAHKAISEGDAQVAAARYGFGSQPDGEEGDFMGQIAAFAMKNPEMVKALLSGLGGQSQGNVIPPKM